MDKINDNLVEAMDALCIARARQRVSTLVDDAIGATYHAETAIKAKQVIKEILDLKDRSLLETVKKKK